MLNGLDLFSGIGGISLALSDWVRPIAYCENDRYAQGVLLSRMSEGRLPQAPIWDDVCTLSRADIPDEVDIVYGGFPCQDISIAGHGRGLAGERSGLFHQIVRLTEETRAPLVFLENVPAIRTRGLREVIRAFTNLGYDCRWTRVSAQEVGAYHRRERWFLLASNTHSAELRQQQGWRCRQSGQSQALPGHNGEKGSLANAESFAERKQDVKAGAVAWEGTRQSTGRGSQCSSIEERTSNWATEPNVGRVANGVQHGLDRLKALGNSVVPLQAKEAFMRLTGLHNEIQ